MKRNREGIIENEGSPEAIFSSLDDNCSHRGSTFVPFDAALDGEEASLM
jgi:hypothetical protein